jgi:hypothetical protein
VADFLSLAQAIIARLPRRKGDGTLATFSGEVNRWKCPLALVLVIELPACRIDHEQEHEHNYESCPRGGMTTLYVSSTPRSGPP